MMKHGIFVRCDERSLRYILYVAIIHSGKEPKFRNLLVQVHTCMILCMHMHTIVQSFDLKRGNYGLTSSLIFLQNSPMHMTYLLFT